jgi:hypothetical protein
MSQKLIEIAKVFQTPLRLNAKAGDQVLIMTDTQMDPLLWQGLATAAACLDMEPIVTVMPPRAHHAANPAAPVMSAARDPAVDLVVYLTSTAMAHAKITEDLVDAGKKFILMEELTVDMLKPGGPAWADYEAMPPSPSAATRAAAARCSRWAAPPLNTRSQAAWKAAVSKWPAIGWYSGSPAFCGPPPWPCA